ncbi:hypothetical protein EB001_02125 [bacterium]|nr:hypothetical protein [bacterium]
MIGAAALAPEFSNLPLYSAEDPAAIGSTLATATSEPEALGRCDFSAGAAPAVTALFISVTVSVSILSDTKSSNFSFNEFAIKITPTDTLIFY